MQLFILPTRRRNQSPYALYPVGPSCGFADGYFRFCPRISLSVAFHGSILSASGKLRIQSSVQRYGVLWNDISFGTDYLQRIANFCRAFVCQLFVGSCTQLAD